MRLPVWRSPDVTDIDFIRHLSDKEGCMGSDLSPNIYLLRNKYNIEICFYEDVLLRLYNGHGSRFGYAYPVGVRDKNKLQKITGVLEADSRARGIEFRWCLVTSAQKDMLEAAFPLKYTFTENADDGDYIYLRENLAQLKGRKYHKKKNHVLSFAKKYPDAYIRLFEEDDKVRRDALEVARIWNHEKGSDTDNSAKSAEYAAIQESIGLYDKLQIRGAVLYVGEAPVAMTAASALNNRVCDIHFEKAVAAYAKTGAYAAINKMFAETLTEFEYINREEDIGIEGLRKAKESYHPEIFLNKYQGKIDGGNDYAFISTI